MRDKTKKYRGHKTMGYGGMKRHRGKGHKGGKGRAGAGKHKHLKHEWGRRGFTMHGVKREDKTINIEELNKFDGEVNLTEMGYNKLLGSGSLKKPLKIIVEKASERAMEKVKEAGGEIITG